VHKAGRNGVVFHERVFAGFARENPKLTSSLRMAR
jgi:hypothetical protein